MYPNVFTGRRRRRRETLRNSSAGGGRIDWRRLRREWRIPARGLALAANLDAVSGPVSGNAFGELPKRPLVVGLQMQKPCSTGTSKLKHSAARSLHSPKIPAAQ